MRSLRQKLFQIQLMLMITLNTLNIIIIINEPQYYYMERFNNDINYCPKCISYMEEWQCNEFFGKLEDDTYHINNLLNILMPKFIPKLRDIKWLHLKDNTDQILIGKYLNRETNNNLKIIQMNIMEMLQAQGQGQRQGQGQENKFIPFISTLNKWQFCPWENVRKFADILQNYNNLTSWEVTWFYLNIDIQLLLMPLLWHNNFPVPLIYKKCGFTLFQQSFGDNLYKFYTADFSIKLQICKQLIEAALQFSYGLDNYRIYLTDLTPDNIVYDIQRNQLSLIDLNTIYIVDTTTNQPKLTASISNVSTIIIHRHVYEFCYGCFAFVPNDICKYHLSDINIFSICHLFMEDLYGRHEYGFLYPIPYAIEQEYPNFRKLLQKCVTCSPSENCPHRFHLIKEILIIVNEILEN